MFLTLYWHLHRPLAFAGVCRILWYYLKTESYGQCFEDLCPRKPKTFHNFFILYAQKNSQRNPIKVPLTLFTWNITVAYLILLFNIYICLLLQLILSPNKYIGKPGRKQKVKKEKEKPNRKYPNYSKEKSLCLCMKCFVLFLQVNVFFLFSYDLISILLLTQIVLFLGLGRQEATQKEERVSAVTGCES